MRHVVCPVLVGREHELEALRAELAAALDGHGRLVLVTGEAGIGKTRLGREVLALARAAAAATATGRAVPGPVATPFRPVTEALLQLLRSQPLPDDPSLQPWRPLLRPVLPQLGEVVPDAPVTATAEAVVQLLARLASPAGLCLLLDDVHWADPDSIELLGYLADNLDGTRTLVVATSREQELPSPLRHALSRRSATAVPVRRLGRDEVAAMVQACLPGDGGDRLERALQLADGVPFLVEELLVAPGVPASFRDTVETRVAALVPEHREVLAAAAVLGSDFDWRLLAPTTGRPVDVVTATLDAAAAAQLLRADGEELAFRHALTREAVLETVLPPQRQRLASAALHALEVEHPDLRGGDGALAARLALQAGDRERAATLLCAAGRDALSRGALATAEAALREAARLGDPDAPAALVETLALAGRVDDAAAAAMAVDPETAEPESLARLRLDLAEALVAAGRWPAAADALDALPAVALAASQELAARAAVLRAELALAAGDVAAACRLVEQALQPEGASADTRCHGLLLLGRAVRLHDRPAAAHRFAAARDVAEQHDRPLWRLRAEHELGTIDMFDHLGTQRLLVARRTAEDLGAVGTTAVIDLQLAAIGHCRLDLDASLGAARSALSRAEELHLDLVAAKARYFLAENAAFRGDADAMAEHAARAIGRAPDDRTLAAFVEGGCHGMWQLLHGDLAIGAERLRDAAAVLATIPSAEPAAFRAVWPLVLAATGDPRAARAAVATARRLSVDAFDLNAGLLAVAEAVLVGRERDPASARRRVTASTQAFAGCDGWLALARALAADCAGRQGWDDPRWWAAPAVAPLRAVGFARWARRCEQLLGVAAWTARGVSAREAEVLLLVAEGLSNKEIAVRLMLSVRTVEKHVEALLRKLDARSRAQLAAEVAAGRDLIT